MGISPIISIKTEKYKQCTELLTTWVAETLINKIYNAESMVRAWSDWETKKNITSIIHEMHEAVWRAEKKLDRERHDLRKLVRLDWD